MLLVWSLQITLLQLLVATCLMSFLNQVCCNTDFRQAKALTALMNLLDLFEKKPNRLRVLSKNFKYTGQKTKSQLILCSTGRI